MILRELLNKLTPFNLTLEAGSGGLSNNVTWNHIGEEYKVAEYIQGGEIVSLTGFRIGNDEEKLLEYMKELEINGATGIIISLGDYIDRIPESLIAFGDEYNFPVFSTPWETWLVELNRRIGEAIIEEERCNTLVEEMFRTILFMPDNYKYYLSQLRSYGFNPEALYKVFVVQQSESSFKDMQASARSLAENTGAQIITMKIEKQWIFIFTSADDKNLSKLEAELEYMLDEDSVAGCSLPIKGVKELSGAFEQAEEVIKLRAQSPEISITSYADIGVYQVLFDIKDRRKIKKFYHDNLAVLEQYDKENTTKLMQILRCYVQEDGSTGRVAARLGKHRNTITKRVEQISELLGVDLGTNEGLFKIMLALKLQKIIEE